MFQEIYRAINEAANLEGDTPNSVWIKPYNRGENFSKNQFAVFLKPEATAVREGVKVEDILNLVFDAFSQWSVEVGAIRVLTSDYLRNYQIMDRHYGVINDISRRGYDAISEKAKSVLEEAYESELRSGAEILGGHQFIERFPAFSPLALSTLSDNLAIKKLAGGTYCISLRVEGKPFLVLNAFHPFQLEYFTTPGRSILLIEGRSETSWSDLRQKLVGATNPANAVKGSIRRTLLERREELGLSDVSQGANGIHLSAGPLEGMVELQRFFSDLEKGLSLDFQETCFGQLLLSKGATEKSLTELAKNPLRESEGRSISAFDLTEEIDALPAAEKLV